MHKNEAIAILAYCLKPQTPQQRREIIGFCTKCSVDSGLSEEYLDYKRGHCFQENDECAKSK